MCRVALEVLGQINDLDGLERTFLQSVTQFNIRKDRTTQPVSVMMEETRRGGGAARRMRSVLWRAGGLFGVVVVTLTHIPHPMHSSSDIHAILLVGATSMHSLPILTTGHDRLHSCRHFLGLHLSALTMAIRVSLSDDDIVGKVRGEEGCKLAARCHGELPSCWK